MSEINNPLDIIKRLDVKQNVTIRVIDEPTGKIVQEHIGHNAATNSLLTGIAHYLMGDGVLNQGADMLSMWVPQYISLGTMGLTSQDSDEGLPIGIGYTPIAPESATEEEKELNAKLRYEEYINQAPGFGADGYDAYTNNDREWFGLGYPYSDKPNMLVQDFYDAGSNEYILTKEPITQDKTSIVSVTVYPGGQVNQDIHDTSVVRIVLSVNDYSVAMNDNNEYVLSITNGESYTGRIAVIYQVASEDAANCELINNNTLRSKITYRSIIPEVQSEIPNTLDVIYSAFVSVGALKEFKGANSYIYITEAGLWSKSYYNNSGDNGLLAGYRIMPTDDEVNIMGSELELTATGEDSYSLDALILSIDSITCDNTYQTETYDGVTSSFGLARDSDLIYEVSINDTVTSDYTIEDGRIVFDTALQEDDVIVIKYHNPEQVITDEAYHFSIVSNKTELTFANGYIPVESELVILIYRSGDAVGTWKDMSDANNRRKVQENIIRIGTNQVAQIIWKLQLGGLEQLNGLRYLYPSQYPEEVWHVWSAT